MTTTDTTTDRDQLAHETAEYIANVLTRPHRGEGIGVHYPDDRRPPTTVTEIKATLLDGHMWISWMDDRVTAAMRELHGPPVGDAAFLVPALDEGRLDDDDRDQHWSPAPREGMWVHDRSGSARCADDVAFASPREPMGTGHKCRHCGERIDVAF